MAIFPGAVATDQDLAVAKDRSSSVLNGAINNSTLTVTVTDGTKFIANEIITIEDEQMQIASIASNVLTMYARGYGGTTAASHADATAVKGNYTANHHNKLKDEIIALETASVDTSWTAPTLLNSWINYGSSYQTAAYMKDRTGRVWLRGMIKNGTATTGTTILTLPSGYRPPAKVILQVISFNSSGGAYIEVLTTGDCTINNASNGFVSIEASFSTL